MPSDRAGHAARRTAAGVLPAAALLAGLAWLTVGTARASNAPSGTLTVSPPSTTSGTGTPTTSTAAPSTTTTVTRTVSGSTTATATVTVTVTSGSPAGTGVSNRPASTVATTATVTRAPRETQSQTSAPAIAIALGVLVLAVAGLGYYFVHRNRGAHVTDTDWDAGLARMQATARWLSGQAGHVADPALTHAERIRMWDDSRPMVADLERKLVDAQRATPDPPRAARAAALAQAVAAVRGAVEAGLRTDDSPDAADRDARVQAAARQVATSRQHLDDLLDAPPPVRPGAAPS